MVRDIVDELTILNSNMNAVVRYAEPDFCQQSSGCWAENDSLLYSKAQATGDEEVPAETRVAIWVHVYSILRNKRLLLAYQCVVFSKATVLFAG